MRLTGNRQVRLTGNRQVRLTGNREVRLTGNRVVVSPRSGTTGYSSPMISSAASRAQPQDRVMPAPP